MKLRTLFLSFLYNIYMDRQASRQAGRQAGRQVGR